MNAFKNLFLVAGATFALVSCADTPEPGQNNPQRQCNGAKCDAIDGTPACTGQVVSERVDDRGARLSDGEINGLDDPFARYVLRTGEECPTLYGDVMNKLREFDNGRCEDPTSGISTMVVTESAQLLDVPTNYRTVVARQCTDITVVGEAGEDEMGNPTEPETEERRRDRHELVFSLFGVSAVEDPEDPPGLPQRGVEVMAFDKSSGVFNYYVMTGSGIEFHGNSMDMIDEKGGKCQQCHTGGGFVMKELDTPWVHWEGHHDTPGARDLVNAYDDLGSKSSGSTMESITKAANRAWNETRVANLQFEGRARKLLEPLFCHVEINLDNGRDFADSGSFRVNADFMLDPHLLSFGSVSVDLETYNTAIADAGQFMSQDGRSTIQDGEGNDLTDTIFAFTYMERAHADNDFVDKLEDAGIIDEELMLDILAVDFSRPLDSPGRCAMLKLVPEEAPDEITPDNLRAWINEALDAQGALNEFEDALKTNLNDEERTASFHKDQAKAFFDACKARPEADFMADALVVSAALREQFRGEHVFEFALTLPFDQIGANGTEHFDPETCELVD